MAVNKKILLAGIGVTVAALGSTFMYEVQNKDLSPHSNAVETVFVADVQKEAEKSVAETTKSKSSSKKKPIAGNRQLIGANVDHPGTTSPMIKPVMKESLENHSRMNHLKKVGDRAKYATTSMQIEELVISLEREIAQEENREVRHLLLLEKNKLLNRKNELKLRDEKALVKRYVEKERRQYLKIVDESQKRMMLAELDQKIAGTSNRELRKILLRDRLQIMKKKYGQEEAKSF